MPPAYLVADINVTDPETYKSYTAGVPACVARFGGRFLVRGGKVERKEGGWTPGRFVLIEFPDRAAAEGFYNSDEYQALIRIRQSASTGNLLIVEGA